MGILILFWMNLSIKAKATKMKYFDNDDLTQKSCDENDSVLVKYRQPVINLATKQAMVANQLPVLHK